MALYTAAQSTAGINTAGRAYFTLAAGATRRLRIKRIGVAMPVAATTAPSFQLLRMTVAGVTPGATMTPTGLDPNDAASAATLAYSGFGTQPTLTTASPLQMATLPLTAGAGWVWNFADPIIITNGTANGIAIYNLNASGATLGTFIADFLFDE